VKALICGVSGQDGAYLAQQLLERGYEVFGASRDAQVSPFRNLQRLGIKEQVNFASMVITDFRSVITTISKIQPDEIYNLAGQSSVGLSFEQPVETMESIVIGTLNLLEGIRFIDKTIKLYNAGSSECFGDIGAQAADESTLFHPRSPYAVAKAAAYWELANYREAYDLHACTGILFNHESPLRPTRFVTQKIVAAACRIVNGDTEKLHLGNIDITRDWGWAPEYTEAMWLMLQQDKPDDFVIATGKSYKLESFISAVFSAVNLDWHDHVVTDEMFSRPTDLSISKANPEKAEKVLGWRAKIAMPDVARMMVEAQQRVITESGGVVKSRIC